jgi:hypothetical protein
LEARSSGTTSDTRLARKALALYNREGIFTNRADDREGFERALADSFSRHEIETEGSFALFAAWP